MYIIFLYLFLIILILIYLLEIINNSKKDNFKNMTGYISNKKYKQILKIDRLDIIIKYLYAKYIFLDNEKNEFINNLYKKHIYYRTIINNVYPDKKKSVYEYQVTFKDLYKSIKENGFCKSKIMINDDFYHKDGSHRIAIALLLGLDIPYIKCNFKQNGWGETWFKNINKNQNDIIFSNEEIEYILYNYFLLKSEWNVIVLYSPVIYYKNIIFNYFLNNNINILYSKNINFNKSYQLKNFLRELYSFDIKNIYKSSNCVINKKFNKLNKYPREVEIIFINKFDKTIKSDLRNLLSKNINVDEYITAHSADSIKEREYMINILLNHNTLELIMNVEKPFSNKLDLYLNEFSETLKSLKLKREDTIIVGSSILDVYNLRETTDIDFSITKKVRDNKGFNKKSANISKNVDIVSQYYSYHNDKRKGKFYPHQISDNNLIYDPLYFCLYRGFKFCTLKIIYDVKKSLRRCKDLNDIKLIDDLFNKVN